MGLHERWALLVAFAAMLILFSSGFIDMPKEESSQETRLVSTER